MLVRTVILSLLESLSVSNVRKTQLSLFKAMLHIDLLLGKKQKRLGLMECAGSQSRENLAYFTEKHVREALEGINVHTSAADVVKLRYLSSMLKSISLQQELLLRCAEGLDVNTLVIVISLRLLEFEEIDVIDNQINQAIIKSV